jgi:hypothetical protein
MIFISSKIIVTYSLPSSEEMLIAVKGLASFDYSNDDDRAWQTFSVKIQIVSRHLWLTPVILTTQEEEIRRTVA